MIIIDLTNEQTYGEPGPNLVIRGTKDGMKLLINSFNKMLINSSTFDLQQSQHVKMTGLTTLKIKSSIDGKILSKINNESQEVIIDLSIELWSRILNLISDLELKHGFQFIEFDDLDNLVEDANIIIHSLDESEL
jgi:hypothetical protein